LGLAATETEHGLALTMTLSDDIRDYEPPHGFDPQSACAESRMRGYIAASAALICLIGWILH
jgi:hypothetical protein